MEIIKPLYEKGILAKGISKSGREPEGVEIHSADAMNLEQLRTSLNDVSEFIIV